MAKNDKRKYFKVKPIPLGVQNYNIIKYFPNFDFIDNGPGDRYWVGMLQPTLNSPSYTVKIVYCDCANPKVYILEPEILKNAPHRYKDEALCLFYPDDFSFTYRSIIAKTIMPWTAEWLYFYERWLEEGVWWGREAPHEVNSLKGKKIIKKHNKGANFND